MAATLPVTALLLVAIVLALALVPSVDRLRAVATAPMTAMAATSAVLFGVAFSRRTPSTPMLFVLLATPFLLLAI